MELFGVFDGHGGKQAAIFASKHMLPVVLEALKQRISEDQLRSQEHKGVGIPAKHTPDGSSERECSSRHCSGCAWPFHVAISIC